MWFNVVQCCSKLFNVPVSEFLSRGGPRVFIEGFNVVPVCAGFYIIPCGFIRDSFYSTLYQLSINIVST